MLLGEPFGDLKTCDRKAVVVRIIVGERLKVLRQRAQQVEFSLLGCQKLTLRFLAKDGGYEWEPTWTINSQTFSNIALFTFSCTPSIA